MSRSRGASTGCPSRLHGVPAAGHVMTNADRQIGRRGPDGNNRFQLWCSAIYILIIDTLSASMLCRGGGSALLVQVLSGLRRLYPILSSWTAAFLCQGQP